MPQEAYGGWGKSAAMTPGKPNHEDVSLSQQERPSSLPVSPNTLWTQHGEEAGLMTEAPPLVVFEQRGGGAYYSFAQVGVSAVHAVLWA